jgi:hypothetical protein
LPGKVIRPKDPAPASKGYDSRWRRYSESFRKRHPFCAFCMQENRMTLVVFGRTGVLDHKIPVTDGGAFWDENNHHPLCNGHHGGLKRLLENYARETGQVSKLIQWCDDPASRPRLRGDVICDGSETAKSAWK